MRSRRLESICIHTTGPVFGSVPRVSVFDRPLRQEALGHSHPTESAVWRSCLWMVLVRHKSPQIGSAVAMNRILCIGKAIFDDETSLLMGTLFRDWHLEPVAG